MSTQNESRKRPVMVWVISFFVIISVLFGLLLMYLVYSGAFPLPPEQEGYLTRMTALDYAFSGALAAVQLYAAIAFLRLRKIAYYLFSATLVINILFSLWQINQEGFFPGVGQSGIIGMFFGWGISLAICIYAWRLMKRGVLT